MQFNFSYMHAHQGEGRPYRENIRPCRDALIIKPQEAKPPSPPLPQEDIEKPRGTCAGLAAHKVSLSRHLLKSAHTGRSCCMLCQALPDGQLQLLSGLRTGPVHVPSSVLLLQSMIPTKMPFLNQALTVLFPGGSTEDYGWLLEARRFRGAGPAEGLWQQVAAALPHRTAKAVWNCGTRLFHPLNHQVRPWALPCLAWCLTLSCSGPGAVWCLHSQLLYDWWPSFR